MFTERDKVYMEKALALAEEAVKHGEVPVGAVLVHEDKIIAEGFNSPIFLHDPSAHAEIMALRKGAQRMQNYRLIDTTLYVTLEPCVMCASALVHARVKRLVYGASDPRAGAIVSKMQILDEPFLNHRVQYTGGLLAEMCGEKLSQFFKAKRK